MAWKPLPHIVHILGSLGAGGAQRQVLSLCQSTELEGFRHSVVSILGARGEFLSAFQKAGIPIYSCPVRWPESTRVPSYRLNKAIRNQGWRTFEWRLACLLRRINADLVNTHVTASTFSQARAVTIQLKLPWVWTIHGLYRLRELAEPQWLKNIDLIKSYPALVVGVSQATLFDFMDGQFDLPKNKQRVIYNGVDGSQLKKHSAQDWQEQWRIPPEAIVFGTAGRLIPLKRHDLLIQAALELKRQGQSAHIVIAGNGPLREQLQTQTSDAHLNDCVHLVGFQEIETLLPNLDVFVLPSESESFGLALAEALTVGLPAIGTRVGGIPEILERGGGILIEKGSLPELVEAMQTMLDPAVRQRYSREARAVAQQFSIEESARQYAEVYRALLEEARAR